MSEADLLERAVAALRAGGVVLHATEGVWGFACDPCSTSAIDCISALKGRDVAKGFIVIGADAHAFSEQLKGLNENQRQSVLDSWPGAHTWILPDDEYPPVVRGFRETLACRVPGHPQARTLCAAFGGTLVSTSANLSGQPAASTGQAAAEEFAAKVDYVLAGEVLNPGVASTIHTLDGRILR